MIERLRKALAEEFGPWLRAKGKKPTAQQVQESFLLWKTYGRLPTQYLRAQLYLQERGRDIRGYMPFSLIEREQTVRQTAENTRMLDNKLLFARHMETAGIATPPVALAHSDGKLIDLWGAELEVDEADARMEALGAGIVKPIAGHYGQGIRKLDGADPAERAAVIGRDDDFLVQPFLEQHERLAELYPTAVNTVRIATWLNGPEPVVLAAALKVGVGGNFVDNVGGAGGLVVGINQDTGKVFAGARQASRYGTGMLREHPDTGARFAGVEIPWWKQLVDMVEAAALAFPGTGSIGWDVAVTPGGPVLIEGNRHWSASLFQLAGIPLAPTAIGEAAGARRAAS